MSCVSLDVSAFNARQFDMSMCNASFDLSLPALAGGGTMCESVGTPPPEAGVIPARPSPLTKNAAVNTFSTNCGKLSTFFTPLVAMRVDPLRLAF